MGEAVNMQIIARIHSDFKTKFGIPRQSGLVEELRATVVFEEEYRDPNAVRGLEDFTHIWLIWQFSASLQSGWSPTVRPPRLGGNARMGVFATRSPFRPSPIGLSSVRLDRVELDPKLGPVLYVAGADLMDGTPILDIKPYVPDVDSHPEAGRGFTASHRDYQLKVEFPPELLEKIPDGRREALLGVLEQDPRPSYQTDENRRYGLSFAGFDVRFQVAERTLTVVEVVRASEKNTP
ncbi:MAG: tRNA (N6-threonylcarbamoyladenosine(37)-N6)-methyltransferase TrmO [Oscillospiraceae bacterium]|nr:tRNA (N6-threonylcarbamoyladenosine(37)-N6)-methyltransferase TrmO [Oscillospiraceae bacterium]